MQLPESYFDLVRPGILFFGSSPSVDLPLTVPVKQALRWLTRVVFFKVVKAGQAVSYGSTWAPTTQTRVITLPVGYGDGYMRAMSGRAEVLLAGQRLPVVGRICMDQVMVDLAAGSADLRRRVLRPKPDGSKAIILDHVGNVHRFGMPDLEREWTLDGKVKREKDAAHSEYMRNHIKDHS